MKKARGTSRRAVWRSRFWRRAFTVLALATAGVVLTAGAAHAEIDRLDNNPASRWKIESTHRDGGGLFHEGWAEIYNLNGAGPNDYTSISREFVISPFYTSHRCDLLVDLSGAFDGSTATVNIEAIDPRTWTYLSLKQTTVTGAGGYFRAPDWRNGPSRYIVRVSLFGANSFRRVALNHVVSHCYI